MAAFPLPPGIEEKLSDLSVEIRRLRVIRGASWFALTLFALPVAAIALDSSISVPRLVRLLLFVGWAGVAALSAWFFIVRRLKGEVSPAELAAAIEEKYPSLSERLRTLVELSEHAEPGNGSRALVSVLARETEKRTNKLNFYRAAPTGQSFRTAAVALLLSAVAIVLVFFVRWYTPPVEVTFKVEVSSGDPVVKRGEPVTLTGYLKKTKPNAVLPESAVLIFREVGGKDEKKLPMAGDEKATFSVTRPKVDADFEYAVECGGQRTDWHTVSAVDPVEVTSASSTTATPPEYAKFEIVQKREGLSEIEILQHGTIAYELKLSRPASDGKIEWRPADIKGEQQPEVIPLILAADKQSSSYTHPAITDGTLKFILTGDKGVKTEVPVAVRAIVDNPPRFEKLTGLPLGQRDIRPDRPLKLDIVATDDVAVSKVVVEYSRFFADKAPGETKTEVIPIAGLGTRRVEGSFAFNLAGKASDGEMIRVRVRATDNRSVPLAGLGPQTTSYPDNDWSILRLSSTADPISEQEINGQQDKMESKLEAVAKKIQAASEEVAKVKTAADGKAKLTPDQSIRLDQARDKARDAARELGDVARDSEVVPELRPLAQSAREIADKHLRPAEDQLRKAGSEPQADKRDEATTTAAAELEVARAALDELRKKSSDTARDRLTRERLNALAEEQKKLAEETAKAEANKAAELAAKQKELRDRLEKLFKENDPLKKDAEKATQENSAALNDELRNLKRQQEQLDEANRAAANQSRQQSAEELRKKQNELAKKADELKKKTDTAARLGQTDPLDTRPAANAAEKITGDKSIDALTEQEKAARELDRLAEKLADQAKNRSDAKEAAKQIARWQEDLRRRAEDLTRQNPNGLPRAAQDKLQAEQKAIQKATERLQLPASDSLQKAKSDASQQAGVAADAVGKSTADAEMKKSADALNKLAEQTPSNAERMKAAKSELEKLRREQDAIAREASDAVKAAEGKNPDDPMTRDELAKKLKDTAAKQDELSKKIQGLDTPGLEQRRDNTADAGQKASDDLRKGLPQDIPASQADAKRRMDRLRDALGGETPADDKAQELARLQRQLTDDLTRIEKPNADELQRLQRRQKEINRLMAELNVPEAAGEKSDARDAGQAAESALNKKEPDVDELRKKSKDAADRAQKLAEKVGGESPEEKLDRLARNREDQAQKATDDAADRGADLTRTREAQQQLDQDAADLANTRTGEAQAAKKKAAEALDRLKKTQDPDRQKELQKAAADAMKELAQKVRKNGDRKADPATAEQPNSDPADPTDPNNGLPTEEQAKAARDLAKQQRELRDELSRNAEQSAKSPAKPGEKDPLGDLAKEQAQIAKQADELAKKATGIAEPSSKEAASSTQQATEQLTAGNTPAAEKAGQAAAEQLKRTAEKSMQKDVQAQAQELARKQEELNGKIAEAGKDPTNAATRQQRRQQELAQEAKDLADKLERAGNQQNNEQTVGEPPLKQAAEQARKAGQQMAKAGQEAGEGKAERAAEARKQANEALKQANEAAAKGAPSPKPGESPSPASGAGKSAQQAADQMAQAQGELGKGGEGKPGAEKSMKNAAEQLKNAANQLAQGGKSGSGDDPKPGEGGGGQNPGGNAGEFGKPASTVPPSVVTDNVGKSWGDLPGDVKSKILQELTAKYGEDYAKAIKLYFEQLAERK